MNVFNITTASHIGGREEQQDSVGHWSTRHTSLIIVADGVGGLTGGRAASQTVLRCAADYWKQCQGVLENPEQELTEIARAANDAIYALNPDEKRSPASTLVALYLDQTHAHWVHSGDSRLYWLRPQDGTPPKELQKTRDHSVVQMLLEQDKITPEEVNTHPDKGCILKALGSSSFKGVDYSVQEYAEGDIFLLCTDGYWESIAPGYSILPPKPSDMNMESYATQLVSEAVKINGADESDNTTLAIATIGPENASTSAAPNTAEQAPVKGQTLKMMLMAMLYIFIIFDIILIVYIFILK